MRRTLVATSLLAACALALPATAATPLLPRSGCQLYTDPAGDAGPAAMPGVDRSSVGFKDITGVAYRASDSSFSTVVRIPRLRSFLPGEYVISTFTANKHVVVVRLGRVVADPTVAGAYNAAQKLSSVSVDGAAVAVVSGGSFDAANHLVTVSVDRRGLEKAIGAPLGALSAMTVQTAQGTSTGSLIIDTAAPPANLRVNATDNICF